MKEKVSVPKMGESVERGIIAVWLKADGEIVEEGDELFELETDKATLAVPTTVSGVLTRLAAEGDEVDVGQVVAEIDSDGTPTAQPAGQSDRAANTPTATAEALSPAVRRIVAENDLDPALIEGTGKDGRITKGDALAALKRVLENSDGMKNAQGTEAAEPPTAAAQAAPAADNGEDQTRIKMTRLRKRIAENLVQAKQSSAHLTTFNEVDMSAVMAYRSTYREEFEKKHEVRLGFMSFFVRAAAAALAAHPVANAIIDGDDIVYNRRYNIGVAVSTERGLVVPVIRDADLKSFAEIESEIASFAVRARDKKITIDELTGGTFSITNGGVFGSLLSTPIPSPPQSAILGMHTIQKRPVVVDDEIVIRPMMYLAVTYDHRIMDGKDAVSFLVSIKKYVEDPRKLLLDL